MTRQKLHLLVPLWTAIALASACSKSAPDVDASSSSKAMDKLMASTERAAATAGDANPASDVLKPNERVQGTIQLDLGTGTTSFRSIATKIDDDLGKKTAERLGSSAGQKDLADAKSTIDGGNKVSSQDIQDLADTFAGKTIYTSEIREIGILKQRHLTLQGTSADNARVSLTIQFGLEGDTPVGANLQFTPNGKKLTQSFETERDDKGSTQVRIDRFERVDDDTYSVAGSFTTGKLVPGVLAKDLAGQDIASSNGSFEFAEVHVRPAM